MKQHCPLTYKPLQAGNEIYSGEGLRQLDRRLRKLEIFPYSRKAQIQEAQRLATKLSIQGVQPKISARLNIANGRFEIVEKGGTFIIKPQVENHPQLPENEDLTMHLAKACGIEIPWHGLILCEDGSYSYVIRRFDRLARGEKVHVEDFSQLIGASRDMKYDVSIERCADVLFEHCTYPTLEAIRLLQRLVFSFLVGNEDLHLKNLSLISKDGKIALSPAYDLLNSSIVMPAAQEEMALALNGKKSGFARSDFIEHFAVKNEMLNRKIAEKTVNEIMTKLRQQEDRIKDSFLSDDLKDQYLRLVRSRCDRIDSPT